MSDPVAKVLRIYDPAACRISIGGSPVDCVAGEWGFWSECWTRRYVVFPNTEQTAREMCAEYARGLGPAQASEQPPARQALRGTSHRSSETAHESRLGLVVIQAHILGKLMHLIEIPPGPNWREQLTPEQSAMLPPPRSSTAQERFQELRTLGVPYLKARDLSGLSQRWGDTLAGWAGIDETEFTLTQRAHRELLRRLCVQLGDCPDHGTPGASALMCAGIVDQLLPRARLRLERGRLG
jgi:hypothetical protein